jgi:hypothetical protein
MFFAFSTRSHGTSALSKAVAYLSGALPKSAQLGNTIPLFLESARKKAKKDYFNHRAIEMAKKAAASAHSPHHLLQGRIRSDGHHRSMMLKYIYVPSPTPLLLLGFTVFGKQRLAGCTRFESTKRLPENSCKN